MSSQIELSPCLRVEGALAVPGDKSISHRAVLFGAIGHGPMEIANPARMIEHGPVVETVRGRVGHDSPRSCITQGYEVAGSCLPLTGCEALKLHNDQSVVTAPLIRCERPRNSSGSRRISPVPSMMNRLFCSLTFVAAIQAEQQVRDHAQRHLHADGRQQRQPQLDVRQLRRYRQLYRHPHRR